MSLPLSPSSDSSDIDLDMDPLSSDPTTGVVLHTDAPSDPTTDVDASATQANAIVSAKSFFTENGCSVREIGGDGGGDGGGEERQRRRGRGRREVEAEADVEVEKRGVGGGGGERRRWRRRRRWMR